MKTSILRSPKISFPYQIFNLLSIQKMHMVPQGPTLHPPIKVLFVSITKIELQSFSILQNLNILQTGKSLLTLVFSMGMEAWTVLIFWGIICIHLFQNKEGMNQSIKFSASNVRSNSFWILKMRESFHRSVLYRKSRQIRFMWFSCFYLWKGVLRSKCGR